MSGAIGDRVGSLGRCVATPPPWGERPAPGPIVPAEVAVTTHISRGPSAAIAPLTVLPVVSTSSTRITGPCTGSASVKRTGVRAERLVPARLDHHIGARIADTNGRPAVSARRRASSVAGQMPYWTRRTSALGAGTTVPPDRGSIVAIASARNRAAGRFLRYFTACTSVAGAPTCANGARAIAPSTYRVGARRISAEHRRHSSVEGEPQAKQVMASPYAAGTTGIGRTAQGDGASAQREQAVFT